MTDQLLLTSAGGVHAVVPAKDGQDRVPEPPVAVPALPAEQAPARGTAEDPAAPALGVGTVPASAPHPLVFTVIGTPIPQGSHKAFVVNGYARVTDDNKKTKPWRQDVKHAALDARGDRPPLDGPVHVLVRFVMPRPKSHFRTGRNAALLRDAAPTFPAGKPDLDKLQRSLLDALTAAGVFRDDAQVVRIDAEKVYVDHRFGQVPCAHVQVQVAS